VICIVDVSVMVLEAIMFNVFLNCAFIFPHALFTFENEGVIWAYCNCQVLKEVFSSKVALSLLLLCFVMCVCLVLCFFLISWSYPADS
jgi:hypothetical protein